MARIPDADDLGPRPIPQGRAPRTVDQSGAILGEALQGTAGRVANIADRFVDRREQVQQADARSAILQADIETRRSLENDPDYSTYEERYREAMTKAQDAAGEKITGKTARAIFQDQVKLDVERGVSAVRGEAKRRQVDVSVADLNQLTDSARTQALEAPDNPTRMAFIDNVKQAITSRVAAGDISAEEGQKRFQAFTDSYAPAFVQTRPLAERIKLLEKPAGTMAEKVAPEIRQKMLEQAKKEQQQAVVDGQAQSILGAYRRDGDVGDSAMAHLTRSGLPLEDQLKVQSQVRAGLGLLSDERRRQYADDVNELERSITRNEPPIDAEARAQKLYRAGVYTPEQYTNVLQGIDRANIEGAKQRAGIEAIRAAVSQGLPLDPRNEVQQKALDGLFAQDTSQLQPGSTGWQAQASAYASKTKILPQQATAWTRQAMRSPNADLAASAAQFYGAINATAPDATSEFDHDTKAFAGMVNSMIESGTDPKQAVETSRDLVFNAKPDVIERRKTDYKQLAKQSDSALTSFVDRDFDTWRTRQPDITQGLSSDFNAQSERYFQKTGNIDLARDLAWQDLKRVYGPSKVNGDSVMMAFPPERFGVKPEDIRKDIASVTADPDVMVVPDALTLREVGNTLNGKGVLPSYKLVTKTGDLLTDAKGLPLRYVLPNGDDLAKQIQAAQADAAARAQTQVDEARSIRETRRRGEALRREHPELMVR